MGVTKWWRGEVSGNGQAPPEVAPAVDQRLSNNLVAPLDP